MASVRTADGAIDFEHRGLPVRRFLNSVATYWNAIREGGAAADHYERLVRHGTPHEEAVIRVFKEHFGRR
jgi:hypothetical protein